jgi:hypothetical protein
MTVYLALVVWVPSHQCAVALCWRQGSSLSRRPVPSWLTARGGMHLTGMESQQVERHMCNTMPRQHAQNTRDRMRGKPDLRYINSVSEAGQMQ